MVHIGEAVSEIQAGALKQGKIFVENIWRAGHSMLQVLDKSSYF